MLVTLFGIVTVVSDRHPENAEETTFVEPSATAAWTRFEKDVGKRSEQTNEPGIVTDVNPEQPEKAESPMLVTLFGIAIDVSPEQPENA